MLKILKLKFSSFLSSTDFFPVKIIVGILYLDVISAILTGSLPFKLWLSKWPSPVITRLDSLIIFSRPEIFFKMSKPLLIFEFNSP